MSFNHVLVGIGAVDIRSWNSAAGHHMAGRILATKDSALPLECDYSKTLRNNLASQFTGPGSILVE
jgi:hypothetical protein